MLNRNSNSNSSNNRLNETGEPVEVDIGGGGGEAAGGGEAIQAALLKAGNKKSARELAEEFATHAINEELDEEV